MSLYHTETTHGNGVREIALVGTLDSGEAMANGDDLRGYISGQGGRVLLNLTDLVYLSSAGMRVLMGSVKDLYDVDGEMHLAAAQERVMAVITIGGLTEICEIHRTLEDAYSALGIGSQ